VEYPPIYISFPADLWKWVITRLSAVSPGSRITPEADQFGHPGTNLGKNDQSFLLPIRTNLVSLIKNELRTI
jgi:hypothetical protein